MSEEKRGLGRRLFYDVRLSGNATQSCASCHQPARAFTDGLAHALGSTGASHPRSAMTLANVAYSASLTWADPSRRSLESQARVPMENEHPVEMGLTGHEGEVISRLRSEPLYPEMFRRAFPNDPSPISLSNVRKAIACFERTILSGDSPYDRYVWKDDRSGMSDAALRGMALFFSDRTHCAKCHAGFTFSGPAVWRGSASRASKPAFASNGLALDPRDPGLAKATGLSKDRGRFRVPTLRNVAITAPYMHDGRFATLREVVDHYAGGSDPANPSKLVRGFAATEEEKADLIAFLESLTDRESLASPELADPWVRGSARR
jgi:cytochrome c peroxidase